MLPRILEYENGRVIVTAAAYTIPELKAILDKFEHPEPYLAYIHGMTAPDSQYINISEQEKPREVIFDIKVTLSQFEFDPTDPLLEDAVERIKNFHKSPIIALAEQLAEEIHEFRRYLKNTPLDEDNMERRQAILKDVGKYATEYAKVRKMADDELKVATKGGHEIGMY